MKQPARPNLYLQLKNDIKVTDILLDVGYGRLYDLIDFEDSEFKILQGLDKTPIEQPVRTYREIKQLKVAAGQFKHFNKRFLLMKIDFKDHEFKENSYSLIICNKVMHFYPDIEKFSFLNMFYNSLQVDGLLFVKLNHNKNIDNTDPSYMTETEPNVFQNNSIPSDVRYLVEPDVFFNLIRSRYSLLENHTAMDEKTLSFVIRKICT